MRAVPLPSQPRRALLASQIPTLGALTTGEKVVGALVAVLPATCHCWRNSKRIADPVLLFIWLVGLWAFRLGRKAQKQSKSLRSPEEAAVEGSRFASIDGLAVHYVESSLAGSAPAAAPPVLLHLNHGFGANALTWDPLIESLGSALAARSGGRTPIRIVAHDRLGFGLSGRPAQVSQYGERSQAEVALRLLDATAAAGGADAPTETEGGAPSAGAPASPLPPTVLVGHSIGAMLSARMAVQQRGGGVRGLVLLAPAILARATARAPPAPPRRALVLRAARAAGALAARLAGAALCVLLRLLDPLLRVLLQLLIAQPRFWQRGVATAYADPQRLQPAMVLRYRWPVQVRGSSAGVLRFVRAQLIDARGGGGARRGAADAGAEAPLWDALRALQLPVLVIHGAQDRLVPLANSRRLVSTMPSAKLLELPDCGHCPHEEAPEQVCAAVSEFVASLGLVDGK